MENIMENLICIALCASAMLFIFIDFKKSIDKDRILIKNKINDGRRK
jgi:hypothetical protein